MNLKQDVRSVQDLQRNAPELVRDVAEKGRTVAIVHAE